VLPGDTVTQSQLDSLARHNYPLVVRTFLIALLFPIAALAQQVTTLRTPDHGLAPQAILDNTNTLQLIYYKGLAEAGDIFYTTSTDFAQTFTAPIQVNLTPKSAFILGTVRAPRLTLTKTRPHIVWMSPHASGAEFFYTRLSDSRTAFEPQRNLVQHRPGLDGGGTITVSPNGTLYAIWHAPTDKTASESTRRVFVARSTDDGQSFTPESDAGAAPFGVCACCNLAAFATDSTLYILYRCATHQIHRDVRLLTLHTHQGTVTDRLVARMAINKCIMSTASFARQNDDTLAAFESDNNVYLYPIDSDPLPMPGPAHNRKHPALATNSLGQTLVVWTENTAWNKGGKIAWQRFDAHRMPIGDLVLADDLPANSTPTAFAKPDGSFVIIY
jgi:hypothetical protein